MYTNIFQRVEEKYLITKVQKEEFLNRIKEHISEDFFFKSNIHNIYFDTKKNDLIINSMDKPIFKDKYRLRSYNIPTLEDDVFLEIKSKYLGVVGKRRIKLKLKEYYNYLETKTLDNASQIFKEIDYYFKYYNLIPKIYIAYDRLSYIGKENSNLRITLDTNIRSRRTNLKLDSDHPNTIILNDTYYIMEIKTLGSMPLWLVSTLSQMGIYPTSYSKYGKIYENESKKLNENVKEILNYA